MNRIAVIQSAINKLNAKVYLELGVSTGNTLFRIKAPKKLGVDPQFKFNRNRKIKRMLGLLDARLFEITSDKFFHSFAPKYLSNGLDVAFVDGLHTYKQALVDVENCLKYINKRGFIIMHDCNPPDFASAYPAKESFNDVRDMAKQGKIPGWNWNWNGDVWKAVAHLRISHPELNIFTLNTDWGLCVITRGTSTELKAVTLDELDEADYHFLENDRANILNLKPVSYFDTFINNFKI